MNKLLDIKGLFSSSKVRYLFSGGISFIAEYGTFALFNLAGWNLFLANSVSFSIGLSVSFVLHRTWSFSGDHQDSKGKQALSYIALALCNLILTNIIIGLFVGIIHMTPLLAKIICMAMIIIWNYVIMSRFIFRKRVL